jgi:putative NADPH-quinone reductase
MELDPDLIAWREGVTEAKHIVIVYPQWWGGMPAKMKGVFDRAFLPGFAMNYHDKDPFWDRLLKGRTAEVFMTADTPGWFDRIVYGQAAKKQINRLILDFSGIKPAGWNIASSIKASNEKKRKRWLKQAETAGRKAGARFAR